MYVFKEKKSCTRPTRTLTDTRCRNNTYRMMEHICEQHLMLQGDDIKTIEKMIDILKPFFSDNRKC